MDIKRRPKGRIFATFRMLLILGIVVACLAVWGPHVHLTKDWPSFRDQLPATAPLGLMGVYAVGRIAWIWRPSYGGVLQPTGELVFRRSQVVPFASLVVAGGLLLFAVQHNMQRGFGPSDWIFFAITGLICLGALWQIIRFGPPLMLTAEGITGVSRRRPVIPWQDIESVSLHAFGRSKSITLNLKPAEAPAGGTVDRGGSKARKSKTEVITPSTYGADARVMLAAIEEYRERAAFA